MDLYRKKKKHNKKPQTPSFLGLLNKSARDFCCHVTGESTESNAKTVARTTQS